MDRHGPVWAGSYALPPDRMKTTKQLNTQVSVLELSESFNDLHEN